MAGEQVNSMALKILGETPDTLRVGRYGVVWGGKDLVGDEFTKDTNLWLSMPRPMMYDHGYNPGIGIAQIGEWDKAIPDEIGVWVEGEIAKSQRYIAMIKPLIDAGVLGVSSGAAPHTVLRENGKLKSWGIFEFSLTTTPCEHRTLGVSELRSFAEAHPAVKAMFPEDAGDASGQATKSDAEALSITKQGEPRMPEEKATVAMSEEALQSIIAKTVNDTVKAMSAQPAATKTADVTVTVDEGDRPFKSMAENLIAVKDFAVKSIRDPRLGRTFKDATKAVLGLNIGVDSEGALAIQDDFGSLLIDPMFAPGTLLNRLNPPIPLKGSGIKIPYIRDASRAAGSRFGGVRTYKVAEGATITASALTPLKRLNLELTKYGALYYATEELLEDAGALANQIQQFVPLSIRFDVENDLVNGITNPLGMLASPSLVTVAKEAGQAADTLVMENISKMWSRMYAPCRANAVWLINQDVEPQLDLLSIPIGTGGWPVYMPAGGLSDQPYAKLKGRPVIPVEYCQTIGDLGDILLCDLTQIVSADKGGIKPSSSIHVAFLTDQQCFKFTYRYTAAPGWETTLTPLNSSLTLSPFVALAARA